MIYTGIDLGSRFIKVLSFKDGSFKKQLYDTVTFYKKHIHRDGEKVSLVLEGLEGGLLATGYGRNLLSFDNVTVISEIKAHFYGAREQTKEENFVLVDVGGQDCKVIEVRDGFINDFTMNDKCAASTGRFMEQAAGVLEIPLEELQKATQNPLTLSDTCAVFCESEMIGHLAKGAHDLELAAGVNLAVAKRLAPQIKRYRPNTVYTSGGAASYGLSYFLSELIGVEIFPLKESQFNGALGAAVYLKMKAGGLNV